METKELKIITEKEAQADSPNVLVERVAAASVADGDAEATALYKGREHGEAKNDKGQVMPANVHGEVIQMREASWFLPGMPEASLDKSEADLLGGLY